YRSRYASDEPPTGESRNPRHATAVSCTPRSVLTLRSHWEADPPREECLPPERSAFPRAVAGTVIDDLDGLIAIHIRERLNRHLVLDRASMRVVDLSTRGDLPIRNNNPDTVVAVLHLEHPRTVLQNIGIDVHLNETATLSDIVLAIHGLQNRSVLRLQERERVGDRVIRLDHTNSVAAPRLDLLGVRLVRLGDTVLRDEPGRQVRGSQGSAESVERILGLIDQFSSHVDA